MPRMGQIAIAVFAATLACVGGAAAIGNVTGVSPLSVLHPASNVAVLTVANINQERVPVIAPAVTGMLRPVPTATPETPGARATDAPAHTNDPTPGATKSTPSKAPALVAKPTATSQPSSPAGVNSTPSPSPSASSGSSKDDSDDGDSGKDREDDDKHNDHEDEEDD